jgi:putative oxidoreductase
MSRASRALCYNSERVPTEFSQPPGEGEFDLRFLDALRPLALLLLRVAIGAIFIFHGYPKLFAHTRETMTAFTHMGFPTYFAIFSGVLEFFGGCLLIAGLFTRIAALLLAGEMTVALWRVHGLLTRPMAVNNYEFPLALTVGAFALACFGAGVISLDQAVFGGGGGKPSRKAK